MKILLLGVAAGALVALLVWAVTALGGPAAAPTGYTTTLVTETELDTIPVPTVAPSTVNPSPADGCRYLDVGARPDPGCTPGALNPAVTQQTIGDTVCRTGWTATVRPPVSVTGPIKRDRMQAYGVGGATPAGYELDHLVPLELGGATDSLLNLWPEPRASSMGAGAKDKVENRLRSEVCAGRITLEAARAAIVADWRTAP